MLCDWGLLRMLMILCLYRLCVPVLWEVNQTNKRLSKETLWTIQQSGLNLKPVGQRDWIHISLTPLISFCLLLFTSLFSNSHFSPSLRNPNYPHSFSRRMSGLMPLWPMFLPNDDGDNYKEFTASLPTLKGLKKEDCSFWSDYIRRLKESTGEQSVFHH